MHHRSPRRQAVLERIVVVKPDGYQPSQDAFIHRQVGIVPGLREAVQAQAVRPDLVVVAQAHQLQDVSVFPSREGVLRHNGINDLGRVSGIAKVFRQPNLPVGSTSMAEWVVGVPRGGLYARWCASSWS